MMRQFVTLMTMMLFSIQIACAANDTLLLKAHAAYQDKNRHTLLGSVQQLQQENDILAPYSDYWLMLLNMQQADNQAVTHFIDLYHDYPFVGHVRVEYLKKLGRQQDWKNFSDVNARYSISNAAVDCYAVEVKAINGVRNALASAVPLWLRARNQPSACTRLYDRMQAKNILTEALIWNRFRMALAENRTNLAKAIVKRSKVYTALHSKLIRLASKSPTSVISKKRISFKSQFGREVNLFALNRIAKKSTYRALTAFKKVASNFNAEERAHFYGRLALLAAQRHEPEALGWFNKAESTRLNKEQMAWYARAALRQENWSALLSIIARMDTEQADAARWRYWKARALQTKHKAAEATVILGPLSRERHYYGWLAQGELRKGIASLPHHKAANKDVVKFASNVAIQRVDALHQLDLRKEAKREWAFAIKDFDDKQLIAAAEYAMRKKWFDIGVYAADATRGVHDFALRYPMPYRALIKSAANNQNVDEAWVYGITRQESRFMHYAKSRVGASGLMQLMPATAKWAASKIGLRRYNRGMIHELDTNIALGTFYLGHTLSLMDGHKPMASAAYNAGPSRAKKWMGSRPLEGAIYAETIPFNETRVYVQRVMANVHLYAQQMGIKSMTLRERMGIVPAKF